MARTKTPTAPATLDMTKIIAAAQAKAKMAAIDMTKVRAAVATRSTPVPHRTAAVHMDLTPEDSTRRRSMRRIGDTCSGFNHGAFLNDSQS